MNLSRRGKDLFLGISHMPMFFCLFPSDAPLILDQRSEGRDDGVQNIVPNPYYVPEYAANILLLISP